MERHVDKANAELQDIVDTIASLTKEKEAAIIKLVETSIASFSAHMEIVTSPDNPKTIKEMTAAIQKV